MSLVTFRNTLLLILEDVLWVGHGFERKAAVEALSDYLLPGGLDSHGDRSVVLNYSGLVIFSLKAQVVVFGYQAFEGVGFQGADEACGDFPNSGIQRAGSHVSTQVIVGLGVQVVKAILTKRLKFVAGTNL